MMGRAYDGLIVDSADRVIKNCAPIECKSPVVMTLVVCVDADDGRVTEILMPVEQSCFWQLGFGSQRAPQKLTEVVIAGMANHGRSRGVIWRRNWAYISAVPWHARSPVSFA